MYKLEEKALDSFLHALHYALLAEVDHSWVTRREIWTDWIFIRTGRFLTAPWTAACTWGWVVVGPLQLSINSSMYMGMGSEATQLG